MYTLFFKQYFSFHSRLKKIKLNGWFVYFLNLSPVLYTISKIRAPKLCPLFMTSKEDARDE